MSTLQWQFGGVQVSFENDVPVPSYISFEKDEQPPPTFQNNYDDEEEEYESENFLTGGAFRNWENIHHRYRVVASAEITENVELRRGGHNVNVNFGNEPRTGEWALQNLPLPRQVVVEMLSNHPEAANALTPLSWQNAVRDIVQKPRGFDRPLECTIEGDGEQKWVVKRMRDIGPITPQQRAALERSPGRIRGNMFWFAEREWEFIRRVVAMGVSEINDLLKPEVLAALQSENLPRKAKDVFPQNFNVLFRESWLQGEPVEEEVAPPSPPPSDGTPSSGIGSPAFFPPGFGPSDEDRSGTGSPSGSERSGSATGSPLGSERSGSAAGSATGPARSASGSARSASGSARSGYGSPLEGAAGPPALTGGDSMSTERGFYGSIKRWSGTFQEVDSFRVAAGYEDYMLVLYTEEREKLTKRANPAHNFIIQEIETLHSNNQFEILFPLLYLLKKGLYVASKDSLIEKGLLDTSFDTNTLFSLCQDSIIELKSTERYSNIIVAQPAWSKLKIVLENEGGTLIELNYKKSITTAGTKLELYYDWQGDTAVVNYLPVLLYQMTLDSEFVNVRTIIFEMKNLSFDYQKVIQRIFGPSKTTLENLRQQLLQIQEDFGFYKLNKTRGTAVGDLVYIVFALNRQSKNKITIDDIETWITGGVIQSRNVPYTIVKQKSDVHKYPWIYTASSETNFENTNHIKIDLVCRRKTFVDVQGVGLSLMTFFTAFAATMYPSEETESMMILIDVARTPTDAGLPDPIFCQVLHERLKFQRTFEVKPLLQEFSRLNNFKGIYTQRNFEDARQKLMRVFDIETHAPYRKLFKPPLKPQFLQTEFINLTNDLDTVNLDDETQKVLSNCSKTFTFIRPMFTKDDIYSIYNRFIQSVIESNTGVERGKLEAFPM